jgi:hypothetical protein
LADPIALPASVVITADTPDVGTLSTTVTLQKITPTRDSK